MELSFSFKLFQNWKEKGGIAWLQLQSRPSLELDTWPAIGHATNLAGVQENMRPQEVLGKKGPPGEATLPLITEHGADRDPGGVKVYVLIPPHVGQRVGAPRQQPRPPILVLFSPHLTHDAFLPRLVSIWKQDMTWQIPQTPKNVRKKKKWRETIQISCFVTKYFIMPARPILFGKVVLPYTWGHTIVAHPNSLPRWRAQGSDRWDGLWVSLPTAVPVPTLLPAPALPSTSDSSRSRAPD